jgi:hypothetical protein
MEPVPTIQSYFENGDVIAVDNRPQFLDVDEVPSFNRRRGTVVLPEVANMHDLIPVSFSFNDVDMMYLSEVLVDNLVGVCGPIVELSCRRIPSRMSLKRTCCIVDHPVHVFVSDDDKGLLADCVCAVSSHNFVHASESANRFLCTPVGRRITTVSLIDALHLAEIDFVSVETYGMKSPLDTFHALASLCDINSVVTFDFGTYLLGPQLRCVPLCQNISGSSLPGKKKTRVMFNDLVHAADLGTPGTLDWMPVRVFNISDNLRLIRMKAYPCYVHWLKANFPTSLFSVPRSTFLAKQRISQISRVVGKVAKIPDELIPDVSSLRVELTVSCDVKNFDIFDTCNRILPNLCRELFIHFNVVSIPLDLICTNCRDWLDVAILNQVTRGANERKLSKSKTSYMCHIMNEIGISTDSVLKNLKKRLRSGRYQFDVYFTLPAATLPLPQMLRVDLKSHGEVDIYAAFFFICCSL